MHQIRLEAFQGVPELTLRSGGRDRVDLRLHQVGQAHIRIVGQKGCAAAWRFRVVEVDEAGQVPTGPESFRGAQPIGDIAAERSFFAQPGNMRQSH